MKVSNVQSLMNHWGTQCLMALAHEVIPPPAGRLTTRSPCQLPTEYLQEESQSLLPNHLSRATAPLQHRWTRYRGRGVTRQVIAQHATIWVIGFQLCYRQSLPSHVVQLQKYPWHGGQQDDHRYLLSRCPCRPDAGYFESVRLVRKEPAIA